MRKNIDPHTSLPAFEQSLIDDNLAPNTVRAYVKAVRDFLACFPTLNKENLLRHRSALMEHYSPKTVNQRVMAINRWLLALRRPQWRLKGVRLGRRSFVENVISQADYLYLSRRLRELGELRWHFVVRFLAATGARVSELVQLRVEHVRRGFVDLYTKGNKQRRIYIPLTLRNEALAWIAQRGAEIVGPLFVNYRGRCITPRGIGAMLRVWAQRLHLDPALVHPHAFRHRFAKNFLAVHTDLSLLADLLGHESIETTRIYLRQSSGEQRALVDRVVTW
ncbi:MAG: tyrosine-type recombinase/integrase [Prevotellaceae bacterium]|jgi:site-specific recombinase, phage integrase family|nr:tyrosine-type recombinase/integrase [Prevotellaceae bacterium]